MKKIFLLALFGLAISSLSAQVFNTGRTLKQGTFSVGIEPSIIAEGNSDFILFLHGGYGLKDGIDFSAKIGVLGPLNYFGADVEFTLGKNISLSTGVHNFGNFGLDGTILGTIPLSNSVNIFGGFDLDIVFTDNKTYFPFWIPVGVEVGLKKSLAFILEANIALNAPAYHLIGGGVVIYF